MWETLNSLLNDSLGLIVAFCALVLTVANLWQQRRHLERSTQPLILLSAERHAGGDVFSYKLAVRNRGLGPAVVQDTQFKFGNEMVTQDELARGRVARALPASVSVIPLVKGDALLPGEERVLFSVTAKLDLRDAAREELKQRLGQVRAMVEYQSLYGKKARASYAGDRSDG